MPSKPHILKTLLITGLLLLQFTPVQADDIRVAVSANFTACLDELAAKFKSSQGHTLITSSSSTGKHYAQIKAGAPFDVFLAADEKRPRLLEAEGKTAAGSRFTYAFGKLVLWQARTTNNGDDDFFAVLSEGRFNYLAIANPRLAPYGLAAQQTLIKLELWESMSNKLVRGQTVGQTWQFVASGNAQLGLLPMSQVIAFRKSIIDDPQHDQGVCWTIDDSYHDPITQQAVLLKSAESKPAAIQFLAFLKTESAQKIIKDYGYQVVESESASVN